MASNTTFNDIAQLCKRLGDITKARKAEGELAYYRRYGRLPNDARVIEAIRVVDGSEEIEFKEGTNYVPSSAYTIKPSFCLMSYRLGLLFCTHVYPLLFLMLRIRLSLSVWH